jgi:hypothetical protein
VSARAKLPTSAIVPVAAGGLCGMRRRDFEPSWIEQVLSHHRRALEADDGAVLKCDERSRVTGVTAGGLALVVKEVRKAGSRRRLADALRGSAARRAWKAAHSLLACGVGAAVPVAYLEQTVLGIPVQSLLISEDLRPARTAADYAASGSDRAADALDALWQLAVRLHRSGFAHGDLRAQHVFLTPQPGALEARLIDLEDVRRTRRLSDEQRLHALAQLNASLADELASPEARRRAFARYASALPFRGGERAARERVVRMSLARAHLWRGEGCPHERSEANSRE